MITRKVPPQRPEGSYEDENHRLRDWRPVPDPTTLTTQQLMRELGALKEIMQTRMDAYDTAIRLLQDFANRQPTTAEVVAKVEERFSAVQMQFHERDIRFDRASNDTKLAVDAAFAAAKEAVTKNEITTTKQIDTIISLITAGTKTTDDKVIDIRDRLTAIEGRGQAYSQGFGWIATGIGIVAAIVGAIAAMFIRGGPPLG